MSKFEIVVADGDEHAHFQADTPQAVLEFLEQFLPAMVNANVSIRREPATDGTTVDLEG